MKVTIIRSISIIALLLTFASCSTESTEETTQPADTYVVNNDYTYSNIELEVARLINEHRVSQGLNSLQTINHISNVSEDHDQYMIANNTLTHALFAQREDNLRATVGALSVGENVAYNYLTAQSVVTAWLNSPSHKANMEGNYTHCGISVRANADGKLYFTNIFIRK